MIVDASALLAIARGEPLSALCFDAILRTSTRRISAANLLEAILVVDGLRDPVASAEFDALVTGLALQTEPVTQRQVDLARIANRRFGKGSGHPARLNFGDCFAYALAQDRQEPLLFIGNDVIHTDVRRAIARTE